MLLTIIKAGKVDLPDVVRLNGQVQDLHALLSPDIFRTDWEPDDLYTFWNDLLEDQSSIILVARLNSSVVGYMWFEVQTHARDALHPTRGRIYVHHIGVDEHARGGGIGTCLLKEAEMEAQRRGLSNVVLDAWASNSAAHGFFGAQGYAPVKVMLSKPITIR